jgi:eukaryotic-like serine/threonine-protein kinase
VREPLAWLLGDNLQAASVSANFGDEFYLEVRMLASLDREPYQLAEELRQRLDKVPEGLEDYFDSLNPPPYWKRLARRYPGMVRELLAQTRIGVENEQAIANSVLPPTAAHNLVLGGELVVATTPGAAVAGGRTAVATSAGPKTIADALQWKTSYSFDNQSLEFAMRDLADDVKGNLKNAPFEFSIKIIGGDLEKDGITRNQSVRDFKQESQTVADILTALVRKANPVTTVKDPSEKDQKLVWVIGPDPDDPTKQAVLITTRTAAATKKYTLPEVFVAKK